MEIWVGLARKTGFSFFLFFFFGLKGNQPAGLAGSLGTLLIP